MVLGLVWFWVVWAGVVCFLWLGSCFGRGLVGVVCLVVGFCWFSFLVSGGFGLLVSGFGWFG